MNRRGDKVIEIEMYLKELRSILPNDLEMYLNSFEKRAACERYFEKIKPARSTVAVNALPGEVKIEIDLVAYSKVNK